MDRDQKLALAALAAVLTITAALWLLALWPPGEETPAWLLRAKVACFGSRADGLPDASGWMLLTLQPLLMLGILLAGWGATVRSALQTLWRQPPGRIVLALVAATITAGAAGVVYRIAYPSLAAPLAAEVIPLAAYPRLDRTPAPLALVDESGARIYLQEFRGRPVIITFAYAHCSTVCPLIVKDAVRIRRERLGGESILLVVTLDPERDTPLRLPAIARQWGLEGDEHVLSGSVSEVLQTLAAWGVPRSRDPRTGEIAHPVLIFLVDREGRVAYAVNRIADAAYLLEQL